MVDEERRLDPVGEDRPERDEVGVDARVRLHVGVIGPEQRLGVVHGQLLDLVDVLAAGVEAVPDGALGVLVAEPVAHGQQDRRRRVVLAGDQLQLAALVPELALDELSDGRLAAGDDVERGEVGVALTRDRRGCFRHVCSSVAPVTSSVVRVPNPAG